jgi:hypothetical protein
MARTCVPKSVARERWPLVWPTDDRATEWSELWLSVCVRVHVRVWEMRSRYVMGRTQKGRV